MKRAKTQGKRATAQKEAEKRRLYVEMVRAVRAWIAVECPRPIHDRVDVCLYEDTGCGETIAWFHAHEECPYVRGDLMALEPK